MEFLAWPVVALLLGLVSIGVFKGPLERLIDRTQKLGKGGLEAGGNIQAVDDQQPLSKADDLLKEFDNALLLKREAAIRAWLDQAKLPSGGDRERILVRHLAGLMLVTTFERVYSAIWGRKIAVLQLLNSSGETGADPQSLRPWFEQVAARDAESDPGDTLERWLGFLEGYSLVTRAGPNVVITLEGREFLKYVIHQGHTLFKRG